LGCPKRYFEQVADSIPPAQTSRIANPKQTTDPEEMVKEAGRNKMASLTSATKLPIAADPGSIEPRIFPGIIHEKERKRSRRISSAGGSEGSGSLAMTPAMARLAVKESDTSKVDE
jgi:hypothetical protein